MLRGLKPLSGYKVLARDGEIGKVHDFLFDESRWAVRYLVVDTGKLISGRKILIPPEVVGEPREEKQGIPVRLTREQVRNSPGLEEPAHEQNPPLRSTREVVGYHLRATDGEIGHVDDFIAGDTDWIIRYMAVDTRNWLPGKRVLIVPEWVVSINRHEKKVLVDISREYVKHSPRYDPSVPLSREYEIRFYDYYKWPKYWI